MNSFEAIYIFNLAKNKLIEIFSKKTGKRMNVDLEGEKIIARRLSEKDKNNPNWTFNDWIDYINNLGKN